MKFCFDIDETITIKNGHDYTIDSLPDKDMIFLIRQLHSQGHEIVFFTSRKMESSGHDVGKAVAKGAYNTFKWLEKYDVPYTAIYFGKPNASIYIDDKAFGYNREKVIEYLKNLTQTS
jgi:capsule biosynthesis phosphatase